MKTIFTRAGLILATGFSAFTMAAGFLAENPLVACDGPFQKTTLDRLELPYPGSKKGVERKGPLYVVSAHSKQVARAYAFGAAISSKRVGAFDSDLGPGAMIDFAFHDHNTQQECFGSSDAPIETRFIMNNMDLLD